MGRQDVIPVGVFIGQKLSLGRQDVIHVGVLTGWKPSLGRQDVIHVDVLTGGSQTKVSFYMWDVKLE